MKSPLTMITGIPTSIGLVLVEHPVLAGLIGGWLAYSQGIEAQALLREVSNDVDLHIRNGLAKDSICWKGNRFSLGN